MSSENVVYNERNNTYWKKEFIPSERNLTEKSDLREMVQIKWKGQSDRFAIYQSIEGDSGSSMMFDIMKALKTM